ncbi:hypothetical protein GGF32_009882 [Allomyces javanicus]|nr:hypothetical protein GGF32_009882 [Allomyces javanicus]
MDAQVRFLDFASPPPAMVLLAPPSPPLATLPGDTCPDAHDPANFGISLFLLVGIVLSYVPQQLKIVELRSSEGLSPYFLLLGSVSCISTVANVALLQHDVLKCCDVWSPLTCFENALGLIQVASQAVMFLLILVLFLVYYPVRYKRILRITGIATGVSTETTPLLADVAATTTTTTTAHVHVPSRRPNTVTYTTCERCSVPAPAWRTSQMIGAGVTLYFIAVLGLWMALDIYSTVAPPTAYRIAVQTAAACFGVIATGMSCLQFLPQIAETYRTKRPGALSILTMMMQTPGTLLLIYSLAARPGTNISTYLSYVVAATCQGSLLVMSLIYARRARRRVAADADESDLFVATSPGTEFAQLLVPNASELLYDPDDTSGLSSPSEAGVPTGTAGNGVPARHAASWTSSSDAGALEETGSLLVEDAGTVAPSLIGIASVETGARATSPVVPGTSLRSLRSPRLVASPQVGSTAAVKSLILEKLTESASTIDHIPPVPTMGESSSAIHDAAAATATSGTVDADAQSQAEPFLLDLDHGTTSPVPPAGGGDRIAQHASTTANGAYATGHGSVTADSAVPAPTVAVEIHASSATHGTIQVNEAVVQVPAPPAAHGAVVPEPASPILTAASPILAATSPVLGAAASLTPAEPLPAATLDTGARPQSAATVIYSPDPDAAAATQPAQFVLPAADSVDFVVPETHGTDVVAQTGFTIADSAQVAHAGLVSPPALATSGDAAVHLAQVGHADLVAPAILAPGQLALSVAAGAIAGAIAGAVAHGLPLVTAVGAGKATTQYAHGSTTSGPVARNDQVSSETSTSSATSTGTSATSSVHTVRTSTRTEHHSSSVTHTSSSSTVHHHHTHGSTARVEGIASTATRTDLVASASPVTGTKRTDVVASETLTSGTTTAHDQATTSVGAVGSAMRTDLVSTVIPAASSAPVQVVQGATTTSTDAQIDLVSTVVAAPVREPAHADAVVPAYELPHDDVTPAALPAAIPAPAPTAPPPEPDSTVFATASPPAIRQPVELVLDAPLPPALPAALAEPVPEASLPAPVPAPTLTETGQESTPVETALHVPAHTEAAHAEIEPAEAPSIGSPLDAPTPTAASLADGLDVATPTASRTNITHHRSQVSLELPAAELADALDTPFWDADAPTSPLTDTHLATSPACSDPGRAASATWLSTSQASTTVASVVHQATTATSHASSSSSSSSATSASASTPISVVGFRVPSPDLQLPRPASPAVATTVVIDAGALTLPAADAPFDEAADVSHGEVADPGVLFGEDVGQELLADEPVDELPAVLGEPAFESIDVENDDTAVLNGHGGELSAEEPVDEPRGQDGESIALFEDDAAPDAPQDQVADDERDEAAELESELDDAADVQEVEDAALDELVEAAADAPLGEDAEREPLADEVADVLQDESNEAADASPAEDVAGATPDEAAGGVTFDEAATASHYETSLHDSSDASLDEDAEPETLFHAPADAPHGESVEVKVAAMDVIQDELDPTTDMSLKEGTETQTLAHQALAASLCEGGEPETLFHDAGRDEDDAAADTSLCEEDADSDEAQGHDSEPGAQFVEDADPAHVDLDAQLSDGAEAAEVSQGDGEVLETAVDEVVDASLDEEAANTSLSESHAAADASGYDHVGPDPLRDEDVEHDRADAPLGEAAVIDQDHDDDAAWDEAVDAPHGQEADLDTAHEVSTKVVDESNIDAVEEAHVEVADTHAAFEESGVTQAEAAELDTPSGEAMDASFAEEHGTLAEGAADALHSEEQDDEAAEAPSDEATDTLPIEIAELVVSSSEIAKSDTAFGQVDELTVAHETTVIHDQTIESSVVHSDIGKQEVLLTEFTQQGTLSSKVSHQDDDADLGMSADAVDDAFATPIEAELEPSRSDDASIVQADKPALAESTDELQFASTAEFTTTELEPVYVALAPELDVAGLNAAIVAVQPIKGDLNGHDTDFSAPALPPRPAEFDAFVSEPALVAADADAASVQSAETDRVTPVPPPAVVAMESDAASVLSFSSDGSTPVPGQTLELLVEDEHAAISDTSASATGDVDASQQASTAIINDDAASFAENDESVPASAIDAGVTLSIDAAHGSFQTETTETQLSEEALNDHVLLEPVLVGTAEDEDDTTSASTESSSTKTDAADDAEMQSPTEPCTRDEDLDADLPVLETSDALDATVASGVAANQSAPTLTVIDQVEVSSGSFHAEVTDQGVAPLTEASLHVVTARPSTSTVALGHEPALVPDQGSPISGASSAVSTVASGALTAMSTVSATNAAISTAISTISSALSTISEATSPITTGTSSSFIDHSAASARFEPLPAVTLVAGSRQDAVDAVLVHGEVGSAQVVIPVVVESHAQFSAHDSTAAVEHNAQAASPTPSEAASSVVHAESESQSSSTTTGHIHSTATHVEEATNINQVVLAALSTTTTTHSAEDVVVGSDARMDVVSSADLAVAVPVETMHSTVIGAVEHIEQVETAHNTTVSGVGHIEQVEMTHNTTVGAVVQPEQGETAVVRTDLVRPVAASGVVFSEQAESADLRTDLIVPAATAGSALDQVAHSTSASAAATRTDLVTSSSSAVHNSSSTNIVNSSNSSINTSVVNSSHTSSHTHTHIHTHVHTHTHTSSYSSTSSHSSASTSSTTIGHHAHSATSSVDARTESASISVASDLVQVSHGGAHSTPAVAAAATVIVSPAVGSTTSELNSTTTTTNLVHVETAASSADAIAHASVTTELDSTISETNTTSPAHETVAVNGAHVVEHSGVATLDSVTLESSTTSAFVHETVAVSSADVTHHFGVASELVDSAAPVVLLEPSAPNAAHIISNTEEDAQVEVSPVAVVLDFDVARPASTTQGHSDAEDQDSASSVVTAASPVLSPPVTAVSPIVAATSPAMEVVHEDNLHGELGTDARSDLADTVIVHPDTTTVEPTQVAIPASDLPIQPPAQSATMIVDFGTHAPETSAVHKSAIGSAVDTSLASQVDVSESGSLHSTTAHAATIDSATSADPVSSAVLTSGTAQEAATSAVARTDLIAVLDTTVDSIVCADQAMPAVPAAPMPVQSAHGLGTSATTRTDLGVPAIGSATHRTETSTVIRTDRISSSISTSSATTSHHSQAITESFDVVGAGARTDVAMSAIPAGGTTTVHHEPGVAVHVDTVGAVESADAVSSSTSSVTLAGGATSVHHEHGAAARFDAVGTAAVRIDHVSMENSADGATIFHQTDGAAAATDAVGTETRTDVALAQVPSQTAHGSTVIDTAGRTGFVTPTIISSGSTSVSALHTMITSSDECADPVSSTIDDVVLDQGYSGAATKSQDNLHDDDLQSAPSASAAVVAVAVPTTSTTPVVLVVPADDPVAVITQDAPDLSASAAVSPPASWQPTEPAAAGSTESAEVLVIVETSASEEAMTQAETVRSETQVEILEALAQTQIAQDESLVQVDSASPMEIDYTQVTTQAASVQNNVDSVEKHSSELLINAITSTAASVASRLDTMAPAVSSADLLHHESPAPLDLPAAELSDALDARISAVDWSTSPLTNADPAGHAATTLSSACESAQAASTTSSSSHSSSTHHSSTHHSSTHHSSTHHSSAHHYSTVIHHSTTVVSHSTAAASHSPSTTRTSSTRADASIAGAITSASTPTTFTAPISDVELCTPPPDHQLLQPASSVATTVIIDQGILTLPATSAPSLDDSDLNATRGHGTRHESRSDQVAHALSDDDIQAEAQLDAAADMSLVEDTKPDASRSESDEIVDALPADGDALEGSFRESAVLTQSEDAELEAPSLDMAQDEGLQLEKLLSEGVDALHVEGGDTDTLLANSAPFAEKWQDESTVLEAVFDEVVEASLDEEAVDASQSESDEAADALQGDIADPDPTHGEDAQRDHFDAPLAEDFGHDALLSHDPSDQTLFAVDALHGQAAIPDPVFEDPAPEIELGESTFTLLDEDVEPEPLVDEVADVLQGESDKAAGASLAEDAVLDMTSDETASTSNDEASIHDASDASLDDDVEPETLFHAPANASHGELVEAAAKVEVVDAPQVEPDQTADFSVNEGTETETLSHTAVVTVSGGEGVEPEPETLFHEVTDASQEDEAADTSLGEEDADSDVSQDGGSPHEALLTDAADALQVVDAQLVDDTGAAEMMQDESAVLETVFDVAKDASQAEEAVDVSQSESDEVAEALSDDHVDPDPLQDYDDEHDGADTPLGEDAVHDTPIGQDHGDEAALDEAGLDTHVEVVEAQTTFEGSANVMQTEEAELDVASGETADTLYAEEQDAVVEEAFDTLRGEGQEALSDETADVPLNEAADTLRIELAEPVALTSDFAELVVLSGGIAKSDTTFSHVDERIVSQETTVIHDQNVESHGMTVIHESVESSVFHSDVGKQEVLHTEFTQEEALIVKASRQDAHQDEDFTPPVDAANDAFATLIEAEFEPNHGDDASVVHADKPALAESTDALFADATDFATTELEPVHVALVSELGVVDASVPIVDVQPIKGDLSPGDDVHSSAPTLPPQSAEYDAYAPEPALAAADADAASVQSAETDRVTLVLPPVIVAMESDAASRGDDMSVVQADKPADSESTDTTEFAMTEVEAIHVAPVAELDVAEASTAIVDAQPIKGDLSVDGVEFSAPALPPRSAEFGVLAPEPALVAAGADTASVHSLKSDGLTPVPEPTIESLVEDERVAVSNTSARAAVDMDASGQVSTANTDDKPAPVAENNETVLATAADLITAVDTADDAFATPIEAEMEPICGDDASVAQAGEPATIATASVADTTLPPSATHGLDDAAGFDPASPVITATSPALASISPILSALSPALSATASPIFAAAPPVLDAAELDADAVTEVLSTLALGADTQPESAAEVAPNPPGTELSVGPLVLSADAQTHSMAGVDADVHLSLVEQATTIVASALSTIVDAITDAQQVISPVLVSEAPTHSAQVATGESISCADLVEPAAALVDSALVHSTHGIASETLVTGADIAHQLQTDARIDLVASAIAASSSSSPVQLVQDWTGSTSLLADSGLVTVFDPTPDFLEDDIVSLVDELLLDNGVHFAPTASTTLAAVPIPAVAPLEPDSTVFAMASPPAIRQPVEPAAADPGESALTQAEIVPPVDTVQAIVEQEADAQVNIENNEVQGVETPLDASLPTAAPIADAQLTDGATSSTRNSTSGSVRTTSSTSTSHSTSKTRHSTTVAGHSTTTVSHSTTTVNHSTTLTSHSLTSSTSSSTSTVGALTLATDVQDANGSLVPALADQNARVQEPAPLGESINEQAPAIGTPVPLPAPLVAVDSAVDSDLWSDRSEKSKPGSYSEKQVNETGSETADAEPAAISSESDTAESNCATPVPTYAAVTIVSNPEEDAHVEETETAAGSVSSSVAPAPAKVDVPTAPARVSAPDWATMNASRWMRATVPTFNAPSSRPVVQEQGAPAAVKPASPTAVSVVGSTHFASKDSVDNVATVGSVSTEVGAQVIAEGVATTLGSADQIAADPARRGEGWGVGRWMHGKLPAIDVPSLAPVVVSRVTAVTEHAEYAEFAPTGAASPRSNKDAIVTANDDDTDDEELVPSTEPSLASDLSHSEAEEEEEGDDGSAVPSTRPSVDSLASDAAPASTGDTAALSKRPSLSAISVTSSSSGSSKLHAGPIQKRGGKRAPKKKHRKHDGQETQVHATTTTAQSTKHSSMVQSVTTTSTTHLVSRRASSSSGQPASSASEHAEHDVPAASPAVTASDANVADPTSWSVMNTARWMRSQIPKLEVASLPAIVPVRRTSVTDLAPPTTASLESIFFTESTKDVAGSVQESNATSLVVTDDDDMTENDELAPSTAPSLASDLIHSDSDGEEEEEEDDRETMHLSARPSMDSLASDAKSTEAAAPATLSKRPSLSAISIASSSGGSIKLHAVPTQKRGGKRAPKKKHRKHDDHEPQAIAASTQHPSSMWPITSMTSTRSRRASSSSLTGSLMSERVDTHQAMTTAVALDTNAVHSADQTSSSVGRWMRSRVTSFSSIGSHRDAPVSGPTSPTAASVLSDQDGVAASIASTSSPDAVVTASNVGLWSFLSKLAEVKPANVDVVGTDLSGPAERVAVEDATSAELADRLTPVLDVEEELAIIADDERAVVAESELTIAVEEPTVEEVPAVEEEPVAEGELIVGEEAIVEERSTVEEEAIVEDEATVEEEAIVEEEKTVAVEMEPVVHANDESATTAAPDELTLATEDAPAAEAEHAATAEPDATDGTNAADSTTWSVMNAGKWMRAQLPKMDVPSLPGRRSSITEPTAPTTGSDSTSVRLLKHVSSLRSVKSAASSSSVRSSTTASRATTDDDLTDDDELLPSAAPSLIHSEIEEDEDDHDDGSMRLSARPSMDSLASDTAPAPATLSKRPSLSAISITSSSGGSTKLSHAPIQKRGGKRAPVKGKKAKSARKSTSS